MVSFLKVQPLAVAAFSAFVLGVVSAGAQEMRLVTDHSGQAVNVPVEPLRVVTLNDWTTTVMAYELGANLVGSGGRLAPDGTPFIRSGRELYDLSFGDEIALASIHGELDMELVASLEPDLIIGLASDTAAYREQLTLIAPTLLFDAENGKPPLENYREFAGWLNLSDTFDSLQERYRAEIAAFRADVLDGEAPGSYAALLPNPRDGDIRVYRNYGSLTTVLEDLGFARASIMEQVPETDQSALFSPEIIGEFDADFLFTTHIEDRGETQDLIMEQLDQIAPGYRQVLPSVQKGQFISMSRFHVYPVTFAAMDHVLTHLRSVLR